MKIKNLNLATLENRILTIEQENQENQENDLDDTSNNENESININNINNINNNINNSSNNILFDQSSSLSTDELNLVSEWLPQEYKKFKLKLI